MSEIDNKAFDMMTSIADKTRVDLFPPPNKKPTVSDDAHTALMVAGMTPGIGNAADIVDTALYLLEGRFGQAAYSALAAVPVFGLFKPIKETGEKSYRLYRGLSKPLKTTGNLITSTHPTGRLFTSLNPRMALERFSSISGGGQVLKFNVPLDYIKKHGIADIGYKDEMAIFFEKGLPKNFLSGTIESSDVIGLEAFKKAFGSKGIKDMDQSKLLFNKILDNPLIKKNTVDDVLKTMGTEVDALEKMLSKIN
jgi:hypothetical protein|tara:strand:- start:1439 stop:2194 length:756 start_codon:yes stop_codon:yes gene_type:complete